MVGVCVQAMVCVASQAMVRGANFWSLNGEAVVILFAEIFLAIVGVWCDIGLSMECGFSEGVSSNNPVILWRR